MNYEEKFKNLVAAIKKLQEANPSDEGIQNWVNDNVPELAEPEDEATWLKKYVEEEISCLSIDVRDDDDRIKLKNLKRSLAWLEKQGEQKVANSAKTCKVGPKFKVGDWIVFNGLRLFIKEVVQGYYRTISVNGIPNSYDWDIDNAARLWTIQDAKLGDVLAFDNDDIVMFKDLYDSTTFYSYCYIEDDVFSISQDDMPDWWKGKGSHPAAKEQRDLLFQKMREAGYAWNAEELKLEKVEQNPSEKVAGCATGQDWSEEDKQKLSRIYSILGQAADTHAFSTSCRLIGDKECVELQDFLKSLTHIPIDDLMTRK